MLRRPGWTENLLIFFLSGLQKLEQLAKKCIDLRGEYVEQIPSLVAVACFLPVWAKDLSAPRPPWIKTRHGAEFYIRSITRTGPGSKPALRSDKVDTDHLSHGTNCEV